MNVELIRSRALSIVALVTIAATASTCARRPASEIGQPRETRLVYLQSKAPAAGLRVTQFLSLTGDEKIVTSGGDGRVVLYPQAQVTIADPDADGCVLATFRTDDRPAATVAVPEAIRISGRVPADRLTELRLQYGYGPRVQASQRFRRQIDRALAPNDEENRPLGLELPKSASFWNEMPVPAEGAFTTAWFPAEDTSQIVAWNKAGQVAVEDVPLLRVTPRATLEAPALRFVQTKRLDIAFKGPANAAAEVAAQMYVRGAQWRPEDREFIARYLSVLDRVDMPVFTFAMTIRPYTFGPGQTTIDFLPPWTHVDVRVMDAVVSQAADLALDLPEASTHLDVTAEQLLPASGQTLPLQGTVVLERHYIPMVGATVVYSCYPDKYETTTDRYGNFVIPRACVGRESTVFVSVTDEQFAPSQATRTLVHQPGAVRRMIIEMPERKVPYAGKQDQPQLPSAAAIAAWRAQHEGDLLPADWSPFWTGGQPVPPDAVAVRRGGGDDNVPDLMVYRQAPGYPMIPVLEALWSHRFLLEVKIRVAQEGWFNVLYTDGPCWWAEATSQYFRAGEWTTVKLTPIGSHAVFSLQLTVLKYGWPPQGRVKKGTAVYFVNPIIEIDPEDEDANAEGTAILQGICNWGTLPVFVGDESMGCFEDIAYFNPAGIGIIQLQQCSPFSTDAPASKSRRRR